MLVMCREAQWEADDLDWDLAPRQLSREHEIAVCQYFMDMSGIELLAGELFLAQREQTDDPRLRAIFDSFIRDEQRHSEVARRLSRHYDVHHYRDYELNPHLVRFRAAFVDAVRRLPPDIASAYIVSGELLLDVALLRSLDDFVNDEMSKRAMKLINRDESRHIAVDFHMVEFYASPAYLAWLDAQPRPELAERLVGWVSLLEVLFYASPFFRDVFFRPMDLTDPSGVRLRQAFKRIQLLSTKPGVKDRPFTKFIAALQDAFNDPILGPLFGPLLQRAIGLDPRVIAKLYTDEEERRARTMTFDQLAEEALGVKYAS